MWRNVSSGDFQWLATKVVPAEELELFKTDRVDDRPPGDQQSNTATCSTHSSVDTTKRDRRDPKPTTRANMISFEADAIHVCE